MRLFPARDGAGSDPVRVLFVHAKPLEFAGGAELSLAHHIEHRPAGVLVGFAAPGADIRLDGWDVVVLANLRPDGGVGETGEIAHAEAWTAKLAGFRGRAVRSERDIHPCGQRDARCLELPGLVRRPCACSGRVATAFDALYRACDVVQYLSPLHARVIGALLPSACPGHVVAAPVDLQRFRSRVPPARRPRRALVLADAVRATDDVDDRVREQGYQPWRVDYHSVAYRDMPALLQQCQAVAVMPRMFHAFGRIVVEAMASGCRVLANERVGALSFDDPVAASGRANDAFWGLVLDRGSIT